MMMLNRKTATRVLLVQWARFQNETIKLEGSTLLTGVNGSGKSTVLDAITYLLTGNTKFNQAAKDRDRDVKGYVRGDTKSNGSARYLRTGQVVSYIAMEFWSPVEQEYIVIGVCVESPDEASKVTSNWLICRNAVLEDINFSTVDGKTLYVTPKSLLQVKGERLKSSCFFNKERGTEQVIRAMGLRCSVAKYRSKIIKMLSFNPENNIDQFISDCVLEPSKVDSLTELREQRNQFENIKILYLDLQAGKDKLEEIDKKIQEYEAKRKNLDIRQMMLSYQDMLSTQKEKEDIEYKIRILEMRNKELEQSKKDIEIRLEAARTRLNAAENNDAFRGMSSSIQALENQIVHIESAIEREESQTAKLMRLQLSLSKELSWLLDDYDEEDKKILLHLAEEGYSQEKKREALIKFVDGVENIKDDYNTQVVHLKDKRTERKEEIGKLEEQIKLLESNQSIYPEEIVKAKRMIIDEFQRRGIKTEVRLFAELVKSIKDTSWRKSIETFLGRKRFHIIVEDKYCHTAMEILQYKKIYKATVVITDKLPLSEVKQGSAAEQLDIPNVFARRYANYLLNGIHLCESLEELHEYPKGGLMKNGMLAKSYAVSYMNIDKTYVCMGQDAIEIQKKTTSEKKGIVQKDKNDIEEILSKLEDRNNSLKYVDLDIANYKLDAPDKLLSNQEQKKMIEKNIKHIKDNPDFVAVLEEQTTARSFYDAVSNEKSSVENNIGACSNELNVAKESQKSISGKIYTRKQDYEEFRIKHLELEKSMLDEYEKMRKRRGEIKVLTEKTVSNIHLELESCIKSLETAQIEYCKIEGIDINKRGIGYIPFYRQQYRDIANVKIEEARNRLEEQSKKLESAFMNDFVAEMNETIIEAKREIDIINKELKKIPFGRDTYQFKMEEKTDRMLFFRICKKLEDYMYSPEVYMNSSRDDEEMERDIQEFMDMILQEENEVEYTDYRKYFTYDMSITSRQGTEEIEAELSKKQGSASNGEKQTPYFIILAASLMQCYPRKNCCARLAFIDEAFSALSRERIEQLVMYLENNDFQVIYAAPPEKIASIGQFIKSTVSLVSSGRYTKAIEGLVKYEELYR